MLLLAACADEPTVQVPAHPPPAAHASALPATDFLGPRAVEGVPAEHLCGGDRAALLREGVFGWRVLGHQDIAERRRWDAADAAYARTCGQPFPTRRLLAVGGTDSGGRSAWFLDGRSDLFLLVDDPTPDAPLRSPAPPSRRFYVLMHGASGWVALGSEEDLPPVEGLSAPEVARFVREQGVTDAGFAGGTDTDWGTLAAGIDALAAEGLPPPQLFAAVSPERGAEEEPAAPPGATRALRISETVAVLALGRVGYGLVVDPVGDDAAR